MAARKYKARKASTAKTNPPLYPSFLQGKVQSYNLNMSPPGITKSWLPTTTRCGGAAHQLPQIYHVTPNSSPNPNPNPHNHFLGDSCIAKAVYEMPEASHWCLLKSDLNAKIHPPPTIPSKLSILLGLRLHLNGVCSPHSPSSGLMVRYTVNRDIGPTPTSYWYMPVSIRHECTMADPFDAKRKSMEFTSVVECGGIFYAITLQGALVVMQVDNTRLKVTAVGVNRAAPEMSCRYFKEYLVEIKGEILLVFLIYGKSLSNVDGVEVYRLDFVKLDWIKVERIPGNTLFLRERCIWVDSLEFGCRDDCVYFDLGFDNTWSVYDMKSGCILSA